MKQDSHIDAEIIQNFLKGDRKAITNLVQRWHLKFCKKSYWIVKDSELAKDVAQESWQVIIHNLEHLNNLHSFKSWAFRIVCNKSFDALRIRNHAKFDISMLQLSVSITMEDSSSDNYEEKINQILTEIKGLPVPQQLVVRLFYLEEQSIYEISQLLNISTGTVKSRLFHAREKLKKSINNKSYED